MTPSPYEAQLTLRAPAEEVIDRLTDLGSLHTWNPALGGLSERGRARVGERYTTRVRGVVPARMLFTAIGRNDVEYVMTALGQEERGTWTVRPASSGAVNVAHSFVHRGVLLRAMASAFAPVAEWRLSRLADEVAKPRG